MKTLSLLIISLLCVSIISCEQNKPAPFQTYTFIIDKDNLAFSGGIEREQAEDTIMARNDTLAYRMALIHYKAWESTLQRFEGKLGGTYAFQLQDSLGFNVEDKLSYEVIDSLKRRMFSADSLSAEISN